MLQPELDDQEFQLVNDTRPPNKLPLWNGTGSRGTLDQTIRSSRIYCVRKVHHAFAKAEERRREEEEIYKKKMAEQEARRAELLSFLLLSLPSISFCSPFPSVFLCSCRSTFPKGLRAKSLQYHFQPLL